MRIERGALQETRSIKIHGYVCHSSHLCIKVRISSRNRTARWLRYFYEKPCIYAYRHNYGYPAQHKGLQNRGYSCSTRGNGAVCQWCYETHTNEEPAPTHPLLNGVYGTLIPHNSVRLSLFGTIHDLTYSL